MSRTQKSAEFVAIIPSRYGATRLPGKPLLDIAGAPMVKHVWWRAKESRAVRVVVATDDARIQAALGKDAEVVMTDPGHLSGTDRLADVVDQLGLSDDTLVVNVQGDEPLIPARLIDQVAQALAEAPKASVATLAEPVDSLEAILDPGVVKVVRNVDGAALYFSRAPIPWNRDHFHQPSSPPVLDVWLRHIGIYAYRASFLRAFRGWEPSSLEQQEQLEQLRALHHGHVIQVALACAPNPPGVDTVEDLNRVRRLLATFSQESS